MDANVKDKKPYERQRGEPAVWFRRFGTYLAQRGRRSLLGVVNAERKEKGLRITDSAPRNWREAAMRWDWKGRADFWDEEQQALTVAEWKRREAAQRAREWETSQRLLDKALQMLQFPLARVTKDGDKTTIEPAGWNLRDAAALADTASKLARLALEMSQGRYTITDQEIDARIERELVRLAGAVPNTEKPGEPEALALYPN